MYDLHVIGAGPSGLSSAISAVVKRNAHVIVSDQKNKPGSNVVCSGLFSNNIFSSTKGLGVDINKAKLWPIYGSKVYVAGTNFDVIKKNPVANVFDRSKFDYLLYERAKDLDVRFEFGKHIDGSFKSNNLIAADGPTSLISKIFGLPSIKKYVIAGNFLAPYDAFDFDSNLAHIFVDPKIMPGFFGWMIPHNEDIAEYGMGVDLSYGLSAMPVFSNFISKYFPKLKASNISKYKPSFSLIPVSLRSKTHYTHNKFLPNLSVIGDAAGQTKASTGGGVVLNTQIGQIAGEHYDNPRMYDIMWKSKFLLTFKLHSRINKMFHKNPSELAHFVNSLKSRGLEDFLTNYGDMDYPLKWFYGPNLLRAAYVFGPNILSII